MPATGISALERLIGGLLIRRFTRATPPHSVPAKLRVQQQELASLVGRAGPGAQTRIQIRRLRGLEQSSTNYSLAMIADHLARVNRDLAITITALARNQPSPIDVVIAHYKPDPAAVAADVLNGLDRSIRDLEAALADERAILASTLRHPHPWFGPLPAPTWAAFGPFHQELHLRQARLVAAALPRAD